MDSDTQKFFCLLDEIETAEKLIRAGFGGLQEIDDGNDFYHLPHQLLASGFERLMKCYISLVYEDRNGTFPDMAYMKGLGHDLEDLLDKIRTEFYGGTRRSLVQSELDFLTRDAVLAECIRILSLFGKFGRYYNLDVVAGSPHSPMDPKAEWERLESSIEDVTPFLGDSAALYRYYYPRVNAKLIATLERLARAIAFQFAIGDHSDSRGRLGQASVTLSYFRNLRDGELGTRDYRRSVRMLQERKDQWVRRTEAEIVGGGWPSEAIAASDYDGDWPFRADRVIIERRDSTFCVVNIEGYDFALNGAAASRYQLPFPHDAGMAVLGKSVGPFIEMASRL